MTWVRQRSARLSNKRSPSAHSSSIATTTTLGTSVASSFSSQTESFIYPERERYTTRTTNKSIDGQSQQHQQPLPLTRSASAPTADIHTRPAGISKRMMNALIMQAEQTAKTLVVEAQQSLQTPMRRKNVQLIGRQDGAVLFKCVSPPPPPPPPQSAASPPSPVSSSSHSPSSASSPTTSSPAAPRVPYKDQESLTRSFWDRLKLRRRRHHQPSTPVIVSQREPQSLPRVVHQQPQPVPVPASVPRVFGLTQVHVTMDELVELLGHRSPHASSMLHPGMMHAPLRHTLIDLVNEHACLRSVTMLPPGHSDDAREYLLVEYHHSFETASGKRGFVIAFHSVDWPGSPQPRRGSVRGSMYRSGLVALESEIYPERVDMYCVAEQNLKADATELHNLEASKHRVLGTLSRITLTIEERAKMLLSLDQTHVFQHARRAADAEKSCGSCKDRIAALPPHTEPYLCRKCYMSVCGECSSIWQRGQKDMRLCMECWADATLNRTEENYSYHQPAYVGICEV